MGFLNRLTIDGESSNVKEYTAGTGISINSQGVISATGGGGAVDSALSTTSTNPVQNRVITQRINSIEGSVTNINSQITDLGDDKQDKLTAGANITITGNVISATGGSVTVDSALSTASTNPVENRVITTEINGIKTNVATAQNDIGDLDTRVQALENSGQCIDYTLDGSYANGDLTLTLSDGTTSQSTNIDLSALGEPFRVKQWASNTLNVEIPYCTEDIPNANIPKMIFTIDDTEGADYQIVGMISYELFDAASGGNRVNAWPVCQFTGNGQKELSVRWACMGATRKTAKRINAWVLLKHR